LQLLVVIVVCLSVFRGLSTAQDNEIDSDIKIADNSAESTTKIPEGVIMDGFSAEEEKAIEAGKETFQFQAEVNRLMDIIINSLYKNKEVFLRELISNASDALDKIRFLSLSNPSVLDSLKDLDIKISLNSDLKTLTIRDSGLGMSRSDLVNNLGTVAKSGTSAFAEALTESGDMSLIGQFGVGFYSVYLVADKVRVVSKNNDDDQYIWESTADSNFAVSKDPRGNTLGRGTEITLFLKEDAHEYASESKLEEIIKRHSEFITFPIYLYKKVTSTVEKAEEVASTDDEEDDDDDEDEKSDSDDDLEIEEEEETPVKSDPGTKTEKVESFEWERINSNVAIWSRDKEEITDDEYRSFFKAIINDPTEALTWMHFKAEGEVEFKSILFVPKETANLYDNYKSTKAGIRLYVRKVLIQEDFEDLLPTYLNFIRGVVDSDDLPLNVSRETLQQHRVLKIMAKKLVRKVLEMLRKLASGDTDEIGGITESSDSETSPYITFWEQYSKSIKMGVIEDQQNRSKLAKLLRFKSLKSEKKYISLDDYVKDFKEWQKDIYYVAGESVEVIEKSPFVEAAKAKGVDILFLTDPLDEYAVQHMADFDGHRLQSLTKEGLKFGDEDEDVLKKKSKMYRGIFKPLIQFMKDLFGDRVGKISVSQRVDSSPAVVVTSQFGNTANMERIAKSQTLNSKEHVESMRASKTLEINPRHPIVIELNRLVTEKPDDIATKDLANLLLDTALQTSGFDLEDHIDSYADRIYRTMGSTLSLKSMKLAADLELEDDEEEEIPEKDTSSKNDEF